MKEWEGDVNTLWCFKHGLDSLSLNFCTRVMDLASICTHIPRMRDRDLNRRLRHLQIVCVKVCMCVRVQKNIILLLTGDLSMIVLSEVSFLCMQKEPISFKLWLWKEHVESSSALHTGHR